MINTVNNELKLEDLLPESTYPGFVVRSISFGTFIQISGGLEGLCPKSVNI